MRRTSDLSADRLYQVLTTPTYAIGEAAQLAGLTRNRVSRWIHGYEFTYYVHGGKRPSKSPPVVHSEMPEVSFLDLMDLLLVKILLDKGFSLQRLRAALDEARNLLGTPHFARNRFFANQKHLAVEVEKGSKYLIELLTHGQIYMQEIAQKFDEKIDFEDLTGLDFASRWYPRGKHGLIVVDPQISFGRPTLIGHSIAVENIYDLYLGEQKKIRPVSEWFQIPSHEVRAAVEFQGSLIRA